MFVNILSWTVIGILGGLITYLVYPTKKEALSGILLAGVAGAFFGGIFYSVLRIGDLAYAIDPASALVALLGAAASLRIIKRTLQTEEDFLTDRNKNTRLP